MTPENTGFRECYLHPRKPAVRNCINCERPICRLCEEESGDVLLCRPCKEELDAQEAEAAADPLKKTKFVPAPKRSSVAVVGEVTIFADGSVVAPEVGEKTAEPEKAEQQAPREVTEEPEPSKPSEATPEEPPLIHAPVAERPIERRPLPDTRKTAQPRAPERTPGPMPEELAEEPPRPPAAARIKIAKPAKPAKVRKVRTGPFTQFVYSLPYGIGAAVVVAGLWLLFALLAKQWSQISVFTLGIVVPWAFYKGSTVRKQDGSKVWTESLAPLWLSIPSVVVVAAVVPPMEWLAYKVIYSVQHSTQPFSDFMERFFKGLDWTLVAFGIALAFLIPFMLKSGERWKKPAVRREEELEEPREETEEEDAPEAGPEPD